MKRNLFLIIALSCFLCGCSSQNKDNTLALGKYEMESSTSSMVTHPFVQLKENQEFVFHYSDLSSYFTKGKFIVKDNSVLTLTTDDGLNVYTFNIKEKSIIFDENQSSEIKVYGEETPIQNGAKFVLVANE